MSRERQIDLIDWTQPINWDHPLNEGLVSAWLAVPNKTGFGTATWRDLCGRNHGTLTNMDPASDWVAESQDGRWGHLDFDGTNDSVSALAHSSHNGITKITFGGWVKTDGGPTSEQMVGGKQLAFGNRCFQLRLSDSTLNDPRFLIFLSDSPYSAIWTTSVTADRWYHVIGTYDSSDIKLYVDGVLRATTSSSGTMDARSIPLVLGGLDGFQFLKGSLDSIRLYDRALSANAIAELYHQSKQFYPDLFCRVKQPRFFVPSGGGVTVSPSAASTTLTATIGVVVLGSISITPSESTTTLTAVSPTVVLGSISITPSGSTTTLTATIGTVSVGGLEISPSAASTTLSASIGTVVLGSISITPSEATTTLTASSPTVVLGSITIPGSFSAGLVAASSQYYTGTTIAFGTSDFAIAFWIYLNDTTGVKTVVSLGSVTNGVEHLWLAVSGTSLFMSLNDSVQATRLTHTFGAGFTAGWNHIVVNFDRSANATCWINGTAPTAPTKDISTYSASMNPTTFYVGRKVSGTDYFDGRIDKLVYANSILDSGDIAELVSETRLLNLSSSLAAKIVYGWEMDSSGTQTSEFTTNDLTPTNSPTLEFGYVDVSTTLTASIGSVVTSIVVTPAEASTTLTASIGTVVLGSISITPSESTTTLTASIGGYFFGPVSISPSAASTTLTASIGAVSASASSANYVVTVSETSYHSVSISGTSYHEVTIS